MLKTEAAVQRAQPHSRQQFDFRNLYMREICPLSLQFYGLLAEHQTEDAGKISDQYYAINIQIWFKQQKKNVSFNVR